MFVLPKPFGDRREWRARASLHRQTSQLRPSRKYPVILMFMVGRNRIGRMRFAVTGRFIRASVTSLPFPTRTARPALARITLHNFRRLGRAVL